MPFLLFFTMPVLLLFIIISSLYICHHVGSSYCHHACHFSL
jgi:hypothetical protein